MPQGGYLPEGMLLTSPQNLLYTASHTAMARAAETGCILEGRVVLCDAQHDLVVDINGLRGRIPRREAAVGIEEGTTREIAILSRVGKPVCFKILGFTGEEYILSRKAAQQEAANYFMKHLLPGEVIRARVTHLEQFGAFVDIGCGNISLIGIENISISRISHPRERFSPGQEIYAAVTGKDPTISRITLSHKELLGTWEENAHHLKAGSTVRGTVRSIESYGIFVELTPNLSGLAECRDGLTCGHPVSVYIKSVLPERMKIKLIVIDQLEVGTARTAPSITYFITQGRLTHWRYSPPQCSSKIIETVFA